MSAKITGGEIVTAPSMSSGQSATTMKPPGQPSLTHHHRRDSHRSPVLQVGVSLWMSLGLLSTLGSIAAIGAERIAIEYPALGELSLDLDDLEAFAQDNRITDDFAPYAQLAQPDQLTALRDVLQRRFEVTPPTVEQFTQSPIGTTLLQRLGRVLKTEANENGAPALKTAFMQAAADPQGISLLNLFRQFPGETIRLDFQLSTQVVQEVSQLFQNKTAIATVLQQQATAETTAGPRIDLTKLPDLQQPGPFTWEKVALKLNNPQRELPVPVDVYRPHSTQRGLPKAGVPVAVISHGLASDRGTFAYLAEHLASHGFAVAVLEHPGTSAQKTQQFLKGIDDPGKPMIWLQRPSDVTILLDTLAQKMASDPDWRGQLNLQQVGVLGQSLGGYTVLAVGGAQLDLEHLRQVCADLEADKISFNLALLYQCRAGELPESTYNLRDQRVKAVLAVNPISSHIFGPQGPSPMPVPVMLVASSDDIFAPPVPEQLYPFSRLQAPEKYLVFAEGGTHFSFLGEKNASEESLPLPPEWIGPDPSLVRPNFKALSTAFFRVQLASQTESRFYLTDTYVKSIARSPFNLTLVKSLMEAALQEAIAASDQLTNTETIDQNRVGE